MKIQNQLMRVALLTFGIFTSMLLMNVSSCDAGIVLTVQNATLAQGSTSFVDVLLTGQAGDTLGRFGYRITIEGQTPSSGQLQFESLQSASEQSLSQPHSYVFLGDTDPTYFTAKRGSSGTDPISLEGGDSLVLGNDVSVNGTFLLARLELRHVGPMSVQSHDFKVTLDLASPITEFDRDWDPGTNNNYSPGELTSIAGTISVTAVPEPNSLICVIVPLILKFCRRRRVYCEQE